MFTIYNLPGTRNHHVYLTLNTHFILSTRFGNTGYLYILRLQLAGKRNLTSQYRNVVTNNVGKRDTTTYTAGLQSWEFTKSGTVYMSVTTLSGVRKDTGAYKLNGSDIILSGQTGKDTFKLLSVTSTALQAYTKLNNANTKYTKFWVNYKKQ